MKLQITQEPYRLSFMNKRTGLNIGYVGWRGPTYIPIRRYSDFNGKYTGYFISTKNIRFYI